MDACLSDINLNLIDKLHLSVYKTKRNVATAFRVKTAADIQEEKLVKRIQYNL